MELNVFVINTLLADTQTHTRAFFSVIYFVRSTHTLQCLDSSVLYFQVSVLVILFEQTAVIYERSKGQREGVRVKSVFYSGSSSKHKHTHMDSEFCIHPRTHTHTHTVVPFTGRSKLVMWISRGVMLGWFCVGGLKLLLPNYYNTYCLPLEAEAARKNSSMCLRVCRCVLALYILRERVRRKISLLIL